MKEKGKRKSEKVAIALLFTFSLLVFTSNAFTFSSPDIGNFFDLPGWMPREVPSDRTFGSDDATNMTHRIDATALAAVNALFEAWYERVWYAHCGNSNSWDTAVYGPTALSKRWWLGDRRPGDYQRPYWWYGRDGIYGSNDVLVSVDTNREIRTRRLVEYDNIDRLARALCGNRGGRDDGVTTIDEATQIERPWWDLASRVKWSSSLLDGIPLDSQGTVSSGELPTCDWLPLDQFVRQFTSNEWAAAAVCFENLRDTSQDVYKVGYRRYDMAEALPSWGDQDGDADPLAFSKMKEIEYGEMGENDYKLLGEGWVSSSSTVDVVGLASFSIVTNLEIETNTVDWSFGYTQSDKTEYESRILKAIHEQWSFDFDERQGTFRGSGIYGLTDPSGSPSMTARNGVIYVSDKMRLSGSGGLYVDNRFLSPYYSDISLPTMRTLIAAPKVAEVVGINFHYVDYSFWRNFGFTFYNYPARGDVHVELDGDFTREFIRGTLDYSTSPSNRVSDICSNTRRLVTGRLGAIGKSLAALDRTYCEVPTELGNGTVMSNFYSFASKYYFSPEFLLPCREPTATYDSFSYQIDIPSSFYVPRLTHDESFDSTNVAVLSSQEAGESVNSYIQTAKLNLHHDVYLGSGVTNVYVVKAHVNHFDSMPTSIGAPAFSMVDVRPERIVVKSPGYISVVCSCSRVDDDRDRTVYERETNPLRVAGGLQPVDSMAFRVRTASSTTYNFGETYGLPNPDKSTMPTYPGVSSWRLVNDCTLWTFASKAYNDSSERGSWRPTSFPIRYQPFYADFSTFYKMDKRSYNPGPGYQFFVASSVRELYEDISRHVVEWFGYDPRSPMDVLEQVEDGMFSMRTLENLRLSGGTTAPKVSYVLKAEPTWTFAYSSESGAAQTCTSLRYEVGSGGRSSIFREAIWHDWVEDKDFTSREIPKEYAKFRVELDGLTVYEEIPPEDTPVYGSAASGKFKAASRVDWNWGAMRIKTEN